MDNISGALREDWYKLKELSNNVYMSQTTEDWDEYHYLNRYSDKFTIDQTRVKVTGTKSGIDYIDANHFNNYIIGGAPIPKAIENFWRMIMDNDIELIIALTKFMEKNKIKAHCYWPEIGNNDSLSTTFGNVQVICVDYNLYSGIDIRKFELHDLKNPKPCPKIVYHIHYKEWPDHGVPNKKSFLKILKIADQISPNNKFFVHCSAGIGRAGTFVAIHSLYHTLAKNYNLECESDCKFLRKMLLDKVLELRNHRRHMVQTFDQYLYCFHILSYLINRNFSLKISQ